MISRTRTLAADPLSHINCKLEPPWIGLVCLVHPTDFGGQVAMLLKGSVCSVAGSIILLKVAPDIREHRYHEGVNLVYNNV